MMNNLFDIQGKVVVITGGTGVLGRAISAYLAQQGARVVIMGRKAEVGQAIVDDIRANGGEAMFLQTDVMKREVLEETGLAVTSYRFRGIVTFVQSTGYTEYMLLFTADAFVGELRECNEGDLAWVKKEELDALKKKRR